MRIDPSTAGLASFRAILSSLLAAILGLTVWVSGFGVPAAVLTYLGAGFGLMALLTLWSLRPVSDATKPRPVADRTL